MESLGASSKNFKKSAIRQKFFLFSMNKNKKQRMFAATLFLLNLNK